MKLQNTNDSYFRHFVISSLLHLIISLGSEYLIPKYGFQSQLMRSQGGMLKFLANFDGFHYIFNNYTHLPNFAFLPGYTTLVNVIIHYLPNPILILALLNKIFFWFSIVSLKKICNHLHLSPWKKHKCILIFIYNPVAVFFHSIYSQSFYCLITFSFIENQLSPKVNKIKSVLLLMIAISIRSTTLFLLPIVGIPIIYELYLYIIQKNVKNILKQIFTGSVILLCTLGAFGMYLFWAYNRVCTSQRPINQCFSQSFVNIYSYVQKEYWNVGFLTYFQPSNIVFILFGTPSIFFSLICLRKPKNPKQFGFQLSFWILLFVTVTMTNLQSGTRFFCTHPAFFINLVQFLYSQSPSSFKIGIQKLFKIWQLSYFYIGILLFSLQFPWT